MKSPMRVIVSSLGFLALVAVSASAQGTISTQGFGYPAGGVSTRSAAGGGAFAEFDYVSSRNPSGVLGWGRGGLYFQYDPEFRSVSTGSRSDNTVTARFPLVAASIQAGSRTIVSLSSSTFLDRTWATNVRGGQILGADSVGYQETVQSDGAINDVRLATAVSITDRLSVGLGIHGYTGENRLHLLRTFDDSLKYGAIDRKLTLGYLGKAISVGATWRLSRVLAVAASARAGGSLDMRVADTLLASAHVPNRYGFAVRFDGLPGASIAFSADHNSWSRMTELATSAIQVHDGWDYSVGAEMTGPKLGLLPVLVYAGFRDRDLPFTTSGAAISERMFSTGASMPISGPRTVLDVALQRASRGSLGAVKETAFILSVGLTLRP